MSIKPPYQVLNGSWNVEGSENKDTGRKDKMGG